MDLYSYIDQIEDRFDDPVALERIRSQAREDRALADPDRDLIVERIGTYLADLGEQDGPFDPDTVPDEDNDGA